MLGSGVEIGVRSLGGVGFQVPSRGQVSGVECWGRILIQSQISNHMFGVKSQCCGQVSSQVLGQGRVLRSRLDLQDRIPIQKLDLELNVGVGNGSGDQIPIQKLDLESNIGVRSSVGLDLGWDLNLRSGSDGQS